MTGPSVSVSVIVPVRDGARYLTDCLDSIRDQTAPPGEVVVVDDGSSDTSAALADAYGAPVRCIRRPGAGPGAARNAGVAAALGELLAFLDADDLWHPDRLRRQLQVLDRDPGVELVEAWSRNFWSPELDPAARRTAPQERHTHDVATPKPGLIISWLLRRSAFDRVGPFDESLALGSDGDWRDRATAAGVRTHVIDDVLALRRLHLDNLTRRRYDEYLQGIARRNRARLHRG